MNEIRVGQVWKDTIDNEEVVVLDNVMVKVVREMDNRYGDQRGLGWEFVMEYFPNHWKLVESSSVKLILEKYND